MVLINKKNNVSILLSGILAIIVGLGVARFAFTSLLPPMLDNYLTIADAGILASLNYVGYLSGAIFAISIKNMQKKVIYFRLGMVICIITTITLAFTKNEILWLISRTLAGFGSAMAMVVGSALVMKMLNMKNKTKAMGIHFSGIGFSILVSDLIMRAIEKANGTWEDSWLALSIFAVFATFYSMYILSYDKKIEENNVIHKFDKAIFTPFVMTLIFSYFTAGIGYVVFATFLPDIINSIPGLEEYGSLTWTLVGIVSIPSCIIWMKLADRYGSVSMILIAMTIEAIGILIPAFSSNLYLNLLSGIFYGITTMTLVALFMNLGGQIAKDNPVVLMGALTTSYGIGMVIGPLYSIKVLEVFDSYDFVLILTASIVLLGVFFLYNTKIFKKTNN